MSRFPPSLRVAATLGALICLLGVAGGARAWDPEADKLADRLAYSRLTPTARAKVDALLSDRPQMMGTPCRAAALEDAPAVVACVHDRRDADFMRGVIYNPIPICGDYDPIKLCPDGRCASQVLTHVLTLLKDPATSHDTRVLALMAVAYLTPELHQPLHTADNNDHSGDRTRVTLPGGGKGLSLYSIWDNDLVADAIGDADTGLAYVRPLAALHGDAWAQGDVNAWVLETHQAAVDTTYGRLPDPPACGKRSDAVQALGPDYFGVAIPLVRTQIARAGVRLAALLNAALD